MPKKKRDSDAKSAEAPAPFERVQALVRRIPKGRVATYGQLSRMIDKRLTPIGVGWAIRAAKEGAIPWQRVVNSKGEVATDDLQPGLQRTMLEAEGVPFDAAGKIDLTKYGWKPSGDP